MNADNTDAIVERLAEEIERREQEFIDLYSHLCEVRSDIDDWLSEKHYERIEEALNGLPSRLDDNTRSQLEELALLTRIRDGEQPIEDASAALVPLPQLTQQDLTALPMPEYWDEEENDFDARERFEEHVAADHLRDVLRYAETHWDEASSAVRRGDLATAIREYEVTQAALEEVHAAYTLWFECLGVLATVSPTAAGVAGEMVTLGMAALRDSAQSKNNN